MSITKKSVKKNGYRNIGVDAVPPKQICSDANCPWHGELPVRGRMFAGIVTSGKPKNTVIVRWNYNYWVQKYERYERRHSRIVAHSPPCISAKTGDTVRIMECRPLSKTKSFVVIEVRK